MTVTKVPLQRPAVIQKDSKWHTRVISRALKITFRIIKGQKSSQFHAKSITVGTPVMPLQDSGKS